MEATMTKPYENWENPLPCLAGLSSRTGFKISHERDTWHAWIRSRQCAPILYTQMGWGRYSGLLVTGNVMIGSDSSWWAYERGHRGWTPSRSSYEMGKCGKKRSAYMGSAQSSRETESKESVPLNGCAICHSVRVCISKFFATPKELNDAEIQQLIMIRKDHQE